MNVGIQELNKLKRFGNAGGKETSELRTWYKEQ